MLRALKLKDENLIINRLDQRFPATEKCTWIVRYKKKGGQKEAQECGRTESDFETKTKWILYSPQSQSQSTMALTSANTLQKGDRVRIGRSISLSKDQYHA